MIDECLHAAAPGWRRLLRALEEARPGARRLGLSATPTRTEARERHRIWDLFESIDVDGPVHRPAGRSHKHSLQNDRCPDRNLPDGVVDRPDLSGKDMRELFETFCTMATIVHEGAFEPPDEGTQ